MDFGGKFVTLQLTDDPKVFDILYSRKRKPVQDYCPGIRKDAQGFSYLLQFGGKEFVFRPGQSIDMPKEVAQCIIRDNSPSINRDENGELVAGFKGEDGKVRMDWASVDKVPIFTIVDEWDATVARSKPAGKFVCPFCQDDFGNDEKGLKSHLASHIKQSARKETADVAASV